MHLPDFMLQPTNILHLKTENSQILLQSEQGNILSFPEDVEATLAMTSEYGISVTEPDPDIGGDSDQSRSDYFSGWESDTMSLINCAISHRYENGRRYHGYKEGRYPLPNDELEQDRLDLFHHCCLLALRGKLFLAPVGKDWAPQRILDVGTGSGIWAMDIADQYPRAEVTGVDLSPIQPTMVPPNTTFVVDDIEEDWLYQSNSFDYIHIRHVAIFIHDRPKLYRQAFKALKPGGWLEVQELCEMFCSDDDSLPPDNILTKIAHYCYMASEIDNEPWTTVAPAIVKELKNLGCIEVGEKVIKLPVGVWPKLKAEKELGMYWRQYFIDGIEAMSLAVFTKILGWDRGEVDEIMRLAEAGLTDSKFHAYSKFYCTYGRKPEVL